MLSRLQSLENRRVILHNIIMVVTNCFSSSRIDVQTAPRDLRGQFASMAACNGNRSLPSGIGIRIGLGIYVFRIIVITSMDHAFDSRSYTWSRSRHDTDITMESGVESVCVCSILQTRREVSALVSCQPLVNWLRVLLVKQADG